MSLKFKSYLFSASTHQSQWEKSSTSRPASVATRSEQSSGKLSPMSTVIDTSDNVSFPDFLILIFVSGIDPTGAYTGTSELQMERIDVSFFFFYVTVFHFTLSWNLNLECQRSKACIIHWFPVRRVWMKMIHNFGIVRLIQNCNFWAHINVSPPLMRLWLMPLGFVETLL